jgi:hypothetical protein
MTQEQRIDELERQNHRFRGTGTAVWMTVVGALALCIGMLAMSCAGSKGAQQPTVVTGTEFRLVDSSGMTRAVLAMEKGNPVLRFLSQEGKFRAAVGLQDYGPYLFFARNNGKPGTSIGVGPGGPAMAFGDSAGYPRIIVTVDTTGAPKIALRDTPGHTTWTAP